MTTPLGDALVRASKLVNRYPQLPAPTSAFVRPRDGNGLILQFNADDDTPIRHLTGLRKLALWAESFGAFVMFDLRQARAVLDIEGEIVNVGMNVFDADRDRISRALGVAYKKLQPTGPGALMAYLDAAGPERTRS